MAYIENGESALSIRNKMNEGLLVPATASKSGSVVNIVAPEGAKYIYFTAPSDYASTDTYKINGVSYALKSQFNKSLQNPWKNGVIVKLFLSDGNVAYVDDQDAYTKEESISSETLASLGLGPNATPNDAFGKLNSIVESSQSSINEKTVMKIIEYRGTGEGGDKIRYTSISADFKISFAMMLAMKYDETDYYTTNYLFNSYVIPAEILTTDWTRGLGFNIDRPTSSMYSRISSDRKTLYWYVDDYQTEGDPSYDQANAANITYVVLLMGKQ